MRIRICRNCVYAVKIAGDGPDKPVCTNGENSKGRLIYTDDSSSCRNFQPREILVDRPKVTQPDDSEIRFIPLTKGKIAIVDAADYEELSKHKWYVIQKRYSCYAARNIGKKVVYMHREIMKPPKGMVVDHIDSNGLNNRRTNLRVCTLLQNSHNRKTIKASSQYKGVRWNKRKKRWVSSITTNGKFILIGYFKDELATAKAYDKKAKELFGDFAYLNFPLSPKVLACASVGRYRGPRTNP